MHMNMQFNFRQLTDVSGCNLHDICHPPDLARHYVLTSGGAMQNAHAGLLDLAVKESGGYGGA